MSKNNINEVLNDFDTKLTSHVEVYGRVYKVRKMKSCLFADLVYKGAKIQIYILYSTVSFTFKKGDLIKVKGRCIRTIVGEPTIEVNQMTLIASYNSKVPLEDINHDMLLSVFHYTNYSHTDFQINAYRSLRQYFEKKGFFEVHTKLLLPRYNGGLSIPTMASFNNKQIGYFRTTLEERMKLFIASSYEQIYQVGSVFRGGNEYQMLEGYSTNHDMNSGVEIITELIFLLSNILNQDNTTFLGSWLRVDFFSALLSKTGLSDFNTINSVEMPNFLKDKGVLSKLYNSPEQACDKVAKIISLDYSSPVIIENFPSISSPLYFQTSHSKYPVNVSIRAKGYFRGNSLFDCGIEENDSEKLKIRLVEQSSRRKNVYEEADTQEILRIVELGIPTLFGFGLSFDKLLATLFLHQKEGQKGKRY